MWECFFFFFPFPFFLHKALYILGSGIGGFGSAGSHLKLSAIVLWFWKCGWQTHSPAHTHTYTHTYTCAHANPSTYMQNSTAWDQYHLSLLSFLPLPSIHSFLSRCQCPVGMINIHPYISSYKVSHLIRVSLHTCCHISSEIDSYVSLALWAAQVVLFISEGPLIFYYTITPIDSAHKQPGIK